MDDFSVDGYDKIDNFTHLLQKERSDNMHIGEVLVRSAVLFIVLLLFTRLLGKKQKSELTFFNYITGISIGTIAGSLSFDRRIPIADGLTSLFVWSALTFLVGYSSLKSYRLRTLINSEPVLLIKNGKLLENAMKSERVTADDLNTMLREKDIFSIEDVEAAILETSGKLTVMKKPEQETVTRKDMNLVGNKPLYIPTALIVDGHVIERNLTELQLNREWLIQQLKIAQINAPEEVLLAQIQKDGTLHIDKKLLH
jgi:uncharacterized membrane protein YcaP (DUF421 family)